MKRVRRRTFNDVNVQNKWIVGKKSGQTDGKQPVWRTMEEEEERETECLPLFDRWQKADARKSLRGFDTSESSDSSSSSSLDYKPSSKSRKNSKQFSEIERGEVIFV